MTGTQFERSKRSLFFGILLIITLVVIASISAVATVLGQGEKFYSHPVYFIPWAFLALQVLIYPVFIKMDSSRLGHFLLGHAPFLVLFFTVLLSLLTMRSGEIRIQQGETILLKNRLPELGIPFSLNNTAEFQVLGGDVQGSDIKTRYYLKDGKTPRHGVIAINQSLRLGAIRLYQQSGGVGVREILFNVDGKEFNLFDFDDGPILLSSGSFLTIAPLNLINELLSYKWQLLDHYGHVVDKGEFVPDVDGSFSHPSFYLKILKEDYLFISILQVVYAPLSIPLGLIAVVFLILLAWKLWGRKNDPS